MRMRLAMVEFHGFVGSSKSTRGDEGNVKKKNKKTKNLSEKQNGKAAITG